MDITLELDTRYHERQKGDSNHQEKKPEASKSNSYHPQTFSSSSERKKNFQKRDKPHSSLLNEAFKHMDLPPSSYHDSLEELGDEEEDPEEVETMIKVVPCSYHHYLDLFCKLKAEKLFPHCACDNHIDLEGFLPPDALSNFHQLKEAFTTAPILAYLNPSLPTIVETNASNYALGAVLSQVSDSGKHPIAFDSHKIIPAQINFKIHERELLGIV
ncbi:hypothetical protein O181_074590 [Austropuccinia psidii MF-1]|uniref:Reverse transcriptase/retrotransposon-derived protein RNase H-like domain-containing protein n=1 Tax=Austropuccinia psidii MF-1 TaxID=1389203 RepID=A0A9Q3FCP9_9BASI|nr:hypothetical protein [Austropuccinia psidii MF-1]